MANLSLEQKSLFRNPALDGLRGFGCLLVMFGHTQWTDKKTILPGALTAMDFFFVLSGFLIMGLLLSEYDKTKSIGFVNFWKRRAIRLLPVFYVYYFFGLTFFLISKFQPIVGDDKYITLLSTAFYSSNWAMAAGHEMGIFAVTWSLSLEEQFYLLCPILFFVLLKYFNKKTILGVLVCSIVAVNLHRFFLFHEMLASDGVMLAFKRGFYGLDTRSDSLLVGCLGALAYNIYGDRFKLNSYFGWGAVVLLLASFCVRDIPVAIHISENSIYTEFLMSGGLSLLALLGLILVLHVVQNPNSKITRFFSKGVLTRLGLMSYSVYIWHTTVFGGLEVVMGRFNSSPTLWVVKTVIRFSVALTLGYLSFRFIELPILKYQIKKRKFSPLQEEKSA